jgi:hypothetical protein
MPSYSGIFTLQTQMQAIAAGTWTGLPRVIGSAYEGGFYAGQISTTGNGIADYNLVVGPVASAQATGLRWKIVNTGGDPTSVIDGPANSATMNSVVYPAAQFCEGLTIGGFSDWYMPAKNELEVCYYNLKPDTTANNTSSGINANAVPARASNYTAGTPAQTTATDFKDTGTEDFLLDAYWSSTENTSTTGWFGYFTTGQQYGLNPKTTTGNVRAIRRVPV